MIPYRPVSDFTSVRIERRKPVFSTVRPFYWSSTTSVFEPGPAWTLYAEGGRPGVGYKPDSGFHMRAVSDKKSMGLGKQDLPDADPGSRSSELLQHKHDKRVNRFGRSVFMIANR